MSREIKGDRREAVRMNWWDPASQKGKKRAKVQGWKMKEN